MNHHSILRPQGWRVLILAPLIIIFVGCVHGRIGNLPLKIEGIDGDVYIYQGRDNFAHQQTAAEAMIQKFCSKNHPGSSVVLLKKETVDLGTVSFGSTTTSLSGTAVGTTFGNTTSVYGSGTANTYGSASRMRNYDQRIFFQCIMDGKEESSSSGGSESTVQSKEGSEESGSIESLKAQLEELRKLVDEGLITEEDYAAKKADLLKEIN